MSKHLIHRVTWEQVYSGDAYLYGTSLNFGEAGAVFENLRMASGKLICRFYSATNYQAKRTSPNLPLLVPGQEYWLELDIDAEPQGRFFLEVTYFNRQGEQLGFEVLRQHQGTIRYPEAAFSYEFTLKSAGASRLVVKGISVYTLEDTQPFKLDKPLEKRYLAEDLPADLYLVQNLVKTI